MKTKKYLASANSCVGFVNKFESINPEKNSFTYILKGGPGTGKSSFMKKVGKFFENKNYKVEYFYCSSDSDSLDGVRVKNIAIVDGTAPHVTEATIPQVKEKIVNVGEFIGKDIIKNKNEIEKLLDNKSKAFKRAYLYLESLGKIFEEEKMILDKSKNLDEYKEIIKYLKSKSQHLKKRELFNSFISKDGYKSFYKDNLYCHKIILSGNFIENKELFSNLQSFLEKNNIDFIILKSIFLPSETEAIYVTKKDILIVSENAYFENFVNFKNKILIDRIVKKIALNLGLAKKNHKKVEGFYIKNMDFKGLNDLEEKILTEIEDRIR